MRMWSLRGRTIKGALRLLGLGAALVLVALAAADLASGSGSLAAEGCTITLSPGESIQQAIDDAPPGAVICLEEGTWEENLVIEKSVTLRGAGPGKTVIRSAGKTRPVVWIRGSEIEVILEGLTITGAWGGLWTDEAGLLVRGSARVSLTECIVAGNEKDGLHVGKSAWVGLKDCWISDNAHCGISKERKATVTGRGNWVRYNVQDFCDFSPPSGFLRKSPPKPLVDRAEVCPKGCQFSTIQEAIARTRPGGTVHIHEGVYLGGMALVKDLTLEGEGKEKTIITGGTSGLRIAGEAVVAIRNLQVSGNRDNGLVVWGSARVSLTNSQVSGNGCGLWVGSSAQVSLQDCQVSGNTYHGLLVKGSARVTLQGSTVSGNAWGLGVGDSAQVTIQDSQVSGSRHSGLWVGSSAHVTVQGSQVSGNGGHGLYVEDSARVSLKDSQVSGNGVDGLLVEDSAHVTVQGSQVLGNGRTGLSVYDSARARVFNNKFLNNGGYGIWANSSDNIVECRGNVFSGNGRGTYNDAAAWKCR